MSLVFNDPNVYGLLIGLQARKAGPLSGLRFEYSTARSRTRSGYIT